MNPWAGLLTGSAVALGFGIAKASAAETGWGLLIFFAGVGMVIACACYEMNKR